MGPHRTHDGCHLPGGHVSDAEGPQSATGTRVRDEPQRSRSRDGSTWVARFERRLQERGLSFPQAARLMNTPTSMLIQLTQGTADVSGVARLVQSIASFLHENPGDLAYEMGVGDGVREAVNRRRFLSRNSVWEALDIAIRSGQVSADQIAEELGVPTSIAKRALNKLADARVLTRVDAFGGETEYAATHPPLSQAAGEALSGPDATTTDGAATSGDDSFEVEPPMTGRVTLHFDRESTATAMGEALIALEYRWNAAATAVYWQDRVASARIALIDGLLDQPMQATNIALRELPPLPPEARFLVLSVIHTSSFDVTFEGAATLVQYLIDCLTPRGRAAIAEERRHKAAMNLKAEREKDLDLYAKEYELAVTMTSGMAQADAQAVLGGMVRRSAILSSGTIEVVGHSEWSQPD